MSDERYDDGSRDETPTGADGRDPGRAARPDGNDLQLLAMERVRGIRLGASGLHGAMHRAFSTPEGSVERAAAMLALDKQIEGFLSLPGNTPAVAILAVGRIATEVSQGLGAKLGFDSDRLQAQVDQILLAAQLRE